MTQPTLTMMMRAIFAIAAVAAGLLLAAPAAHAELRVEKNHRLASDPNAARGKDAVGLAVNPRNPQHIVQLNVDWLTYNCEYSVSRDGGATWSTAKTFDVPDGFGSTCQPEAHIGHPVDRGIAFGSGEKVYATFAAPRTNILGQEEGASVLVARSDDGGTSFGEAKVALPGGLTSSVRDYGYPKLAVEPSASGDKIYVVALASVNGQNDVATTVSTNSGETWSPVANADPAGESATELTQPVVLPAPSLSVAVAWRRGADIVIARSNGPDASTWRAPVVVASGVDESYPRLAVDRSGGAGNGNLYIVYGQQEVPTGNFQGADHFIDLDMDVYFQRSRTLGDTWSTPKVINDKEPKPGTEVTQTRHPDVSVAPNGRVDIVWQDRRHWYRGCLDTHSLCAEARLGDTYYDFSTNADDAAVDDIDFLDDDRRITDRSHSNDVGFDYRFATYWDYGPVSVPLGNNALLVGWMDSREGNVDTDTQDIYLARVDHQAPAAVPQEIIAQTEPRSLSVRLSKLTYPGGAEGLLAGTFATSNRTKVVIANENDPAGILAGGVLARANLTQLLVAPASGLSEDVKAEVQRMKPAGAYVVGNETLLSNQVVTDLQAAGVPNGSGEIERIGGANDAATAALIAKELDRRTQGEKDLNEPAFDAAIIANPASPDAAAASALAAARRLPILYVGADTPIPSETSDALAELDIDKTLVIGGSQWVSATVEGALPEPKRLSGADQYETSAAVVDESIDRGLPTNIAYVADGTRPVEAALLGSAAGRSTGLLILSQAPLSTTAPGRAAGMGLSDDLDRLMLVAPAPVGPGTPGPGGTPGVTVPGLGNPGGSQLPIPGGTPAFAGCPAATTHVIRGTAIATLITGTLGGDRIFAGAGDDSVDGRAGNDCINLGTGRDRGQGGSGDDLVQGDRDNDRIGGNFGNDRLLGGNGADRIFGDPGRDRIAGGASGDRISGGSSADLASGNSGNDLISGNSGNDRLDGGTGHDRILGGTGRDALLGGGGNDSIDARDRNRDSVNCGPGRDVVRANRSDRVARNCERVLRTR